MAMNIINRLKLRREELHIPKLRKKRYEGFAITEAPRGILYHRYVFDNKGFVKDAEIITPTADNQLSMENDVRKILPDILRKEKGYIVRTLEELIRAYDPCLSCATHFLEVNFPK